MTFWRQLVSGKNDVSSKRFAGLLLIGTFIVITILAAVGGNLPVEVESLAKVGLYTGATLLGVSVAPEMIKVAQRPVMVAPIKPEEEDDKPE